ncbi:conserved hypothetical protein [Ricinus communis]|uniref:Uncharacterized protein n=1 Tax=Ricinus communis TaxID=3988 RepID=B9SMG6_RICCO|nr:conserved hypothetical protein [Ricinus communis]
MVTGVGRGFRSWWCFVVFQMERFLKSNSKRAAEERRGGEMVTSGDVKMVKTKMREFVDKVDGY